MIKMDNICTCLQLKKDIEQLENTLHLTLEEIAKVKAANDIMLEKHLASCRNVICFPIKK
jgi:hypothetical protein